MITKGKILAIDYSSNTCNVHIPIFDTVNSSYPTTIKAIFAIQPGIFNGYVPGDVVEVSFEDHTVNKGVVLGKLYLGAGTESKSNTASIYGKALNITETATLPIDTKLASSTTSALSQASSKYTSILDIINDVIKLKESNIQTNTVSTLPGTVVCLSLLVNLYGYSDVSYSLEKDSAESCYYIKYNNSKTLTNTQALAYFNYMTGVSALPSEFTKNKYSTAFITTDQKVYYPIWKNEEKTLKFMIVKE